MGGAAKGMMHPYDDFSMTFSDMAKLIMLVSLGDTKAIEKVDGINIFWYLHEDGTPRYSLSIGECRNRGLTMTQFQNKLKSHPGRMQFIAGAEAIQYRVDNGMRWMGPKSGQHWVNTEIIYTKSPQTFQYDCDSLVYHDYCMLSADRKSMVSIKDIYQREWRFFIENELAQNNQNPWKLYHELPLNLPPRPSAAFVTDALKEIEKIRKSFNCSFQDSILKVYREKTKRDLMFIGISEEHAEQICYNVWSFKKSKYDIKKIKSKYDDIDFARLDRIALSKNRLGYYGECKSLFRAVFDKFGAVLVSPLESNLIEDNKLQQKRLDNLIKFNVDMVTKFALNHPKVFKEMENNLSRFRALNVDCPVMEGIVIIFNGKKYKFTGAFPSMNRVCGAARYGLGIEYKK
jgi:hypothetical protein